MMPKLYIPSAINIWKKLPTNVIWADKKGLVSGRLAWTSSKTEMSSKIRIEILTLNFQVNLDCFFTQKTWKVKITTQDLNHDLIFYCTQNQLCVPE